MRKKFFAMYALAGALVASPIFTSCVDDTVSSSVEALRGAKVEALKAQAAYDNALAQAALINANADATLKNAQAALEQAKAAVKEADAKEQELLNQIKEGTLEADLAAAIAQADSAKLAAEQALAIAKINAEKALEMAKWTAQQTFWEAEKTHAQNQAAYEKYLAGLDNETKRHAENINGNINAILNGGTYYGWNTSGNWSSIRTYVNTYAKANTYNSINALIAGLVEEKVSLIKLEYGLVDMKEYIAEQKKANDEKIATQKALIEKYTALMGTSSREALVEEYEAAKEAYDDILKLHKENAAELYKAQLAVTEFDYVFAQDPIYKLIADGNKYLTAKDAEEYKATYKNVAGKVEEYKIQYTEVYEHTADDATELATDIETLEGEIETKEGEIEAKEAEIAAKEAEIAQVNGTEKQRELAILEAEFAPIKEAYDKVLASEGYKKYMADLEKAVADAQAAFDKTPTEDLKDALDEAEGALAAADYEYEEGKKLSSFTSKVEGLQENIDNLKTEIATALGSLQTELTTLEGDLVELQDNDTAGNEGLKQLNAELETLKGYQTIFAADSKEMKAYAELCKQYAALEKAWFDLSVVDEELTANETYYSTLKGQLDDYVGDGTSTNVGSLPDYEALIASCEDEIKKAERANEALAYDDYSTKVETATGGNEAAQEKLIAEKKAEIAAMEAELEVRKAEYEAEVAALNALIGAEEE